VLQLFKFESSYREKAGSSYVVRMIDSYHNLGVVSRDLRYEDKNEDKHVITRT